MISSLSVPGKAQQSARPSTGTTATAGGARAPVTSSLPQRSQTVPSSVGAVPLIGRQSSYGSTTASTATNKSKHTEAERARDRSSGQHQHGSVISTPQASPTSALKSLLERAPAVSDRQMTSANPVANAEWVVTSIGVPQPGVAPVKEFTKRGAVVAPINEEPSGKAASNVRRADVGSKREAAAVSLYEADPAESAAAVSGALASSPAGSGLDFSHFYPPVGDESPCPVCGFVWWYSWDPMIVCEGCGVEVHCTCYGLCNSDHTGVIPDGAFWCDACSHQIQEAGLDVATTPTPHLRAACHPETCVICGQQQADVVDAFKAVASPDPRLNGKFAHILCAVWIPECYLADEAKRSPVMGVENISKDRMALTCHYCDRPGACIQCEESRCLKAYHPICARSLNLYMRDISPEDDQAKRVLYCRTHAPADDSDDDGDDEDEQHAGNDSDSTRSQIGALPAVRASGSSAKTATRVSRARRGSKRKAGVARRRPPASAKSLFKARRGADARPLKINPSRPPGPTPQVCRPLLLSDIATPSCSICDCSCSY